MRKRTSAAASHNSTDISSNTIARPEIDQSTSTTNVLYNSSAPLPESPTKPVRPWRKRAVFSGGIVLGAALVWLFSVTEELQPIRTALLDLPTSFDNVDLPAFFESVDLSAFSLAPAREWLNSVTNDFEVGRQVAARNQSKKHAVILIPGIISSGLESWSTSTDTIAFFRRRVWSSPSMVKAIITSQRTWLKLMSLDPDTGLDPGEYKVRAVQGIEAASSFMPGYWLWAKIIENLSVLGYTADLTMASYDWRLSYYNLQERDQYFSQLKSTIELNLEVRKQKTVLVSHSMGSVVTLYFLKWVEAEGHGKGGDRWVEKHIEAFVNIAGTLFGVPKAVSSFISGEMKDTAELNTAAVFLLEKVFSKNERAKLFRSWAGASSMILKGGNAVWGDATSAPDDPVDATISSGLLVSLSSKEITNSSANTTYSFPTPLRNLTMDQTHPFLLAHASTSFAKMIATNYSLGFERDIETLKKNDADHRTWSNPLEHRLPFAPSMKIYCIYGHGKPTERGYFYREEEDMDDCIDSTLTSCTNETSRTRKSSIDITVTLSTEPKVRNGIIYGEGDGTVSLLSLGAMCVDGWKRDAYNPARIPVITHELKHDPTAFDPRGGEKSADHVDVLGSAELNEAILDVASGRGDRVKDQFFSNIREYAAKIRWEEE